MARKTESGNPAGAAEQTVAAAETKPPTKAQAKTGQTKTATSQTPRATTKAKAAGADAQKPAATKPAAKKPAAKKPATKKPAARKPAAKKPAAKSPAPAATTAPAATDPTPAIHGGETPASETASPKHTAVTAKGSVVTAKGSVVTAKGSVIPFKSSSSGSGTGTESAPLPTKDRRRVKRQVKTNAEPATIGRSKFTQLKNVSELRHYLRTSDTPVFFIGATAFNLLGLDRWVRGFSYITYYDSWDGTHPRVFTPTQKPYVEFRSGEEINNWLLRNHEVRMHIERHTPPGVTPQVVMVFFDEETERICEELDYELILPAHALRERLDSKIVTTQIADSVDVPSVPNVLTNIEDWDELLAVAKSANLGTDFVIQTAYGDSGKTTYFVSSEAEFAAISDEVTGVEIKVMRRINHQPVAIEAVLTRHGTVVGPCMTEITGHKELTPYRGGWAGNEMFPAVLDDKSRHEAVQLVRTLGDRLSKEGYRGFFEVDVLLDTDTGDVYLGELNPRISGASSITNVTAGAYADVPLFAFHLLEYSGIDFDINVDEINGRWEELASEDEWSQMVIKHTDDTVAHINVAPRTGRYVLDHLGNLVFAHSDNDWHLLSTESDAFFLRIAEAGSYWWKGADLGILFTKSQLETNAGELTLHAKYLIRAIRNMYGVTEIEEEEAAPPITVNAK